MKRLEEIAWNKVAANATAKLSVPQKFTWSSALVGRSERGTQEDTRAVRGQLVKSVQLVTPYPTMSDDEADPELLELLRETLGLSRKPKDEISSDTGTSPHGHYKTSLASEYS